jgi:hypothetical protein
MVDRQFDSPYGLVHPAVTAAGNVFLTWDEKRASGRSAPAYAYRLAGSGSAAFSAPRHLPGYPDQADAHAPAVWPLGETIYIVWGDRIRNGLYARTFDFTALGPAMTPAWSRLAVLLCVGLCLGTVLRGVKTRPGR